MLKLEWLRNVIIEAYSVLYDKPDVLKLITMALSNTCGCLTLITRHMLGNA
jgi:hypothetical protein